MRKRLWLVCLSVGLFCWGLWPGGCTRPGGNDGGGPPGGEKKQPPKLSGVGALMAGKAFAFVRSYQSPDSFQDMDKNLYKTLIYFENTGAGLQYVKVVRDHSDNGYNAYAGKVSFQGESQATFTDTHLCYGRDWTYDQQKGSESETIVASMRGCTNPKNPPVTYNLSSKTVREKGFIYDTAGKLTLLLLYYALPQGLQASVRPLLGVYQLRAANSCNTYNPDTFLLLFPAPDGSLRYNWLQETSYNPPTYVVEEGTLQVSGSTMTFTAAFNGTCPSAFRVLPAEAPVYPAALLTEAGTCQVGQTSAPLQYSFTYQQTTCGSSTAKTLLLSTPKGSFAYDKALFPSAEFPSTTGVGAHYLWTILGLNK